MSDYKLMRTVIQDEELIEQYEKKLYYTGLSERELITVALEEYFSEDVRTK